MIQSIIDFFSRLDPRWATFWLSMIPVTELRAAIPIALSVYKLSVAQTIIFAVLGDILPAIFILFGFEKASSYLAGKSNTYKKFQDWLFERTRKKFEKKYHKYGLIGLALFVAIPLPGTGSWTGSIAAFLFGLEKKRALIFILLGVIMASILVTLLSLGVIHINHAI
ncbi:MAG: COG2426 family protein [Patescibacteria group bacterium]